MSDFRTVYYTNDFFAYHRKIFNHARFFSFKYKKSQLLKKILQLIKNIYVGIVYVGKSFVPNRVLGEQLEKQQLQLHNNSSLSVIWPNLSLISCWSSVSAKLYLPQLQQIFPNAKNFVIREFWLYEVFWQAALIICYVNITKNVIASVKVRIYDG
jgi:hypothetical protein